MSEKQYSPAIKESGPQFRRVYLRRSSRRRSSRSSNPLISTHDHKPTVATTTASCSSDNLSDNSDDQEEAIIMEDFLRRCESSACLPLALPRNQLCARGCLELRGVSVSVIVLRLSRFLLAHSIEHGFHFGKRINNDDGDDEVRVQCRTERLLRFCVFLWRAGNDDDASDDCVIVEVQRRWGCSLELQCVRRALFKSLVEGEDALVVSNNVPPQQQLSPCHKMIPSHFCKKIVEKYKTRSDLSIDTVPCSDDDDSSFISESINRYKCMLGSPCRQSKELALESFLHLVEALSETIIDGENSVTAVAQTILTDMSIQQELLTLLQTADVNPYRSIGELHTMALQVVAQTLCIQTTTATEPNVGMATIIEAASEFWHSVLHCCQTHVSNVASHNKSSRDVELSIDILKAVLAAAPQAAVRVEELLSDLAVCRSFGRRYFWALEQKSQDLMDQLQMYH